jgi:TonB-linked SusC/RagA family outer membrane protein
MKMKKQIQYITLNIFCLLMCINLYGQQEASDSLVVPFDAHKMSGSVNFGYDMFSRESITGSVSSVTGDVLDKTPTNILSETFYGRLPGLQNVMNLSELTFFGYSNFSKAIRGISSINGIAPLVIIDGVICPSQYYEFITPKEIESVTVLKDASSTAIYGIQGANGAIVITTKRGYSGKRIVEAYADFSIQQMTNRPLFINSAQYAELRNEAGERDGFGAYSQFTQAQIDQFAAGDDPGYPNNNWFDMFIKKAVIRQRVGVNVTGGNDKLRYFSNLNFINQADPFKITNEPDRTYDPTPHTNIVNFRTNMDVDFNQYISGFMRLAGNVKRQKQTGVYYEGSGSLLPYRNIFYQPPTMLGPVSPTIENDPELSNQVVTVDGLDNPVYGLLNRSGYADVVETNVISQAGLKANLDFLTKGLSVSGAMAYQTYARNQINTGQSFQRVVRGDDYSQLDNFTKYRSFENTNLSYSKNSTFFYYLDLLANLEYHRKFGEHSLDASAHTYYLNQEKESSGYDNTVLPYKRQNFGVSALYGYKGRYFLKGDLGYSGSEQFHPDHRYVTTPAVSAAWIASKEAFFNQDIVSLLKIRASYGITANDQIGNSRFLYLDNIRSDGSELERGNPELSAEKIKKTDIGLDLGLLNMFTLNFDYFYHTLDNMLITGSSTVPAYQGVPLSYYPKLNAGAMENKGFEIALSFNKQLNKELSVFAELNFMQAKNKVLSISELPAEGYAYPYRTEGYPVGQPWGYKVDYSNGNGYFNSAEELTAYLSSTIYSFGAPRVGDLKYKDLNEDGTIDEKDLAPMGYSSIFPEQEYSFTGGVTWKNWEFSFLLQGVNHRSYFLTRVNDDSKLTGEGMNESLGKGIFSDIHLNAWTPERYASGEKITYPALSLSPSTSHQYSDFYLQDGAYLRLKNVEIAYILPQTISRKITSDRIRIAFNAQNLLTFDKMKTDYIDPEIRYMYLIQPYRVYNLSLSVNF